mmetsp:Transcript_129719/g.289262  ORF Transcript_129719/g.289262 Transcript_129719/m.289262 type:complete len:449 (-) Transcript_129719:155-1501(-)
MMTLVAYMSMFLRSLHGTAFLAGAAAYILYAVICKARFSRCRKRSESVSAPRAASQQWRWVMPVGATLIMLVAVAMRAQAPPAVGSACTAATAGSGGDGSAQSRASPVEVIPPPVEDMSPTPALAEAPPPPAASARLPLRLLKHVHGPRGGNAVNASGRGPEEAPVAPTSALEAPSQAAPARPALKCKPQLLHRAEGAVQGADELFSLGQCWSDIGLAGRYHHREKVWMADARGNYAPAALVKAEDLLLRGEQASEIGAPQTEKGLMRALLLYRHAKYFALRHLDAAAEWRYQAAAELAAAYGNSRLAGHSLARLGYLLVLRCRPREARDFADWALKHSQGDPLAMYLRVTLRRSLGELRTDAELVEAEEQLQKLAGRMPSSDLEERRAAAEVELGAFRGAAVEGFHRCFALHDSARLLICLLGRLFLKASSVSVAVVAATPEETVPS